MKGNLSKSLSFRFFTRGKGLYPLFNPGFFSDAVKINKPIFENSQSFHKVRCQVSSHQ